VIANEYSNMKGIERIGRNNGLCPYNPYEDIPEDSRVLAKEVANVTKLAAASGRPYESFMFRYNHLVDTYNKFAELSKVPMLKNIKQPDLFLLRQPYIASTATGQLPAQAKQAPVQEDKKAVAENAPGQKIMHDTIRIVQVQQTEVLKRDTVYIEKTRIDTVYVSREGSEESLLSMKGYATNNLVFLLDVSSSMGTPQKLPMLKNSMKLLLQILRPQDEVSVVVYSGNAKVALPPTSARDKDKIIKIIDKLRSEGATDANEGIRQAYKVAGKNYKRGGNNRIILASDGEFTVSREVQDLIASNANADIFLTVFDFGNHAAHARNLQMLAQAGKGNYEQISKENADVALIRQAKAKKGN
jgi:Mg-chelatase subunit ChlD